MLKRLVLVLLALQLFGCNANSSKNQFGLAEQLFLEQKYDASIHEFNKIVQRDPQSEFGIKALQQIATIQQLYLNNAEEALKTYRLLLKRSTEPKLIRETQLTIANLYFERFEDFEKAAETYLSLYQAYPDDDMADKILYRYGRSLFLKNRFDDAMKAYQTLRQKFPVSPYSARAQLEIANALSSSGKCKEAIKKFEEVRASAQKDLRVMAVFEMANCYEILDDLDTSYDLLASIQTDYPNPDVISQKMQKIKRRKILRRR